MKLISKWILGCLAFILILGVIFGAIGSNTDSNSTTTEPQQDTQTQQTAPAGLSTTDINSLVTDAEGSWNVTSSINSGNVNITVIPSDGMFFTENSLITIDIPTLVDGTAPELFAHPEVNTITYNYQGIQTDQYGQQSIGTIVTYTISKDQASKVNWDTWKAEPNLYYADTYNIADSYNIQPSVYDAATLDQYIPQSK
jgi:hypothetical protein